MSTDNLRLWESVQRTDPTHVKPITGKSYQGNSPKPHWLVQQATRAFGPCGIGWGFTIVSERIEDGPEGERMSLAHVRVWYVWEGKRGEVEHVGGTPFSGKRSSGKFYMDEDAPKKSVTDALVKALSLIGFAGDIFLGRWDDSRYVAELRDEFANGGGSQDHIGPDELAYVKTLLRDTETDEAKFLDWIKAPNIQSLTIDKYKKAIAALNAKKAKGKAA